ncbi:hypothetical protein ACQKHK_12605, partial [Staphylococcus capitis]|uniref:hypothetical protein n=1 Tax=Staphylococcus capitis TaxID=29388 RepID=UPI003CFF1D15
DQDRALVSPEGLRAWRAIIERSLSFDQADRPVDGAEFAAGIRTVAQSHPISGAVAMHPTGGLMATRLIDGRESVARFISVSTYV